MNTLRPYQQDLETQIFNEWKKGHRNVFAQLITGGGKTQIFVDIIKKFVFKKKRCMVVAHREELITQAWQTLYRNEIFAGVIKADIQPNYSLPCQVASIQTIQRRGSLPHADLIIIDEGHHALEDNSYGKVLARHYPDAWVLIVSATPYRLGGRGFKRIAEVLVQGPSFKDLVNMGYLCPLRYFIAGIPDLSKVKLNAGDYNSEESEAAMGFAPLVESYAEHARGMCGVTFAVNVHHSNVIVDQYNAAGIRAAHLDAQTHPNDRVNILKKFKDKEIDIISNVGIITEGFDFPDMQFVQLARPTKSLSLFLQMIGRVTRPNAEGLNQADTAEIRKYLISQSNKPYGLVLDNAGLYREHGLPDDEIDWQVYFDGFEKRKKKEITDTIEILQYVAEDEEGRRMITEIPEEVDGLKLIEITKTIKEKIVNIKSLKEFDNLQAMFSNMPKVVKKGFATYNAFRTHCRKNQILLTHEVWDYLFLKLNKEPKQNQDKYITERDASIEVAKNAYMQTETEVQYMVEVLNNECTRKIKTSKQFEVPSGYLKKEMEDYNTRLRMEKEKTKVKI